MKTWGLVAAALAIAGCQPAAGVSDAESQAPEAAAPAPGVAFDRAPGLRTRPCGEGQGPRCIVLFDPAAEEFMRDLLTLEVHDGPLEAVAAREAGFVRDGSDKLMTSHGRFMPVEVESFRVNGNPGLRAVISCGISDPETGFHAAGGECLWAVVSDGERSAVISSSGFGNGLEAAEVAVASLRFRP